MASIPFSFRLDTEEHEEIINFINKHKTPSEGIKLLLIDGYKLQQQKDYFIRVLAEKEIKPEIKQTPKIQTVEITSTEKEVFNNLPDDIRENIKGLKMSYLEEGVAVE